MSKGNRVVSFFGSLMPAHGKRIFLLTTLHTQLVHDGIFMAETLEKLNQALKLAQHDDALKFPAKIYSSVWDEQQLRNAIQRAYQGNIRNNALTYDDALRISESVLDVTGEWLMYGRRDDMLKDLIALFFYESSRTDLAAA